jgi:hypothetical protein
MNELKGTKYKINPSKCLTEAAKTEEKKRLLARYQDFISSQPEVNELLVYKGYC